MIARLMALLTPRRARSLFGLALLGVALLAFLPSDEALPISTGWDKSNHALAFFVLALLAGLSWPRAAWWRPALGLLGYGIFIEVVQYFIGRDATALDVFADGIGIALHAAIARVATHRRIVLA